MRAQEVATLKRLLASGKAEFLAIYGRRRIGKTYLIHEFFKDKGLYFSITGSSGSSKKIQIRKFYLELKSNFPHLQLEKEPKNWDEALHALKEAIKDADPRRRVILFFDELPWLAAKRSGFLQALEYIWNQHFSRMSNILVVVCGSAANWIIKKIVNNKNGLYGRLSEVIKLHPFTLRETEQFLVEQKVNLSRKQIVELYMAFGGIAKYLTYVRPGESAAQTINRLCFTPQGQLVGEFNTLYQSLFEDSHKHIQVIKALAEKKRGLTQKELLKEMQMLSGGQASLVLEELEDSGFMVGRQEFQKVTKDKKWWLVDDYSIFYLTWVERVKGGLLQGNAKDYWLKMQSDAKWKSWSGLAFESICFKHIAQIKEALGISSVLSFESQWSYRPKDPSERGCEIDLVIDRKDDCINLCEIKFCHSLFTIDRDYAENLQRKVALFREQTKTHKTLFLTLISPFGLQRNKYFSELVHSEVLLDDLF